MSAGPDTPDAGAERDLRAAEYVLGTLGPDERSAFERERAADSALEAGIADWERRLAPLSLAVPEENPPSAVWDRILASLAGAAPQVDDRVARLTRQVRRWRAVSGGIGLLAAGLAALTLLPKPPEPAPAARYISVVTSGGDLPALIVSVDTGTGTAQVRPVGAQAPGGKSLELWFVGADKAPKPLGVIGTDASRIKLPDAAKSGEGVFAVSVEPPGGSPTGQPTGQVVYTGKLIRD